MRLTDGQAMRFYFTLRALMTYANDRLGIVREFDFSPHDARLDEKCRLVLQTVWNDPGIVDDFVRDGRGRLPDGCLKAASAWRRGLFGVFWVLGFRDGRALFACDGATFAVAGVEVDTAQMFDRLPVAIETALLPFEGAIVTQGFMRVISSDYAAPDPVELAKLPVCATVEEFGSAVDAILARRNEEELDYLLNGDEDDAANPEGFHRGLLCGLGERERDRLIDEEISGRLVTQVDAYARALERRLLRRAVPQRLGPALRGLQKERLKPLASELRVPGYSKLRKDDLVAEVREAILADPGSVIPLFLDLMCAPEFQTLDGLLQTGELSVPFDSPEARRLRTFEPLTFAYREGAMMTAFIPRELRGHFDMREIERTRAWRRRCGRATSTWSAWSPSAPRARAGRSSPGCWTSGHRPSNGRPSAPPPWRCARFSTSTCRTARTTCSSPTAPSRA